MEEGGITENIGTILMIFLLVVVAIAATVMVTGIAADKLSLEKPTFAMFDAGTIMGYDRFLPHNTDIPVIKIAEIGGDKIDIRYKEGTHSGLEGTKLYLYDPDGNSKEITQSVTMKGESIDAGENFYIFSYYTNPGEGRIWITNDVGRITNPAWGGVERFSPSGTWRIVIVDDDNNGLIILDKSMEL